MANIKEVPITIETMSRAQLLGWRNRAMEMRERMLAHTIYDEQFEPISSRTVKGFRTLVSLEERINREIAAREPLSYKGVKVNEQR